MDLTDFVVGKTYQIKKKNWEDPEGDIVPGETITRVILEPATKENSRICAVGSDGESIEEPLDSDIEHWREFLRVRNPANNHVHLLHPEVIESAVEISDVVYFDPDGGKKYPYITMVEELLGGIGRLMFPDGTVQFAEAESYPDIVSSPRMAEDELEAFCQQNLSRYQAYYDANEEALLKCDPVPPICRFWES